MATSPRAVGGARLAVTTKPDDIIAAAAHHTIPEEEKRRFVEYINGVLKDDVDLKHLIPVDPTSMAFFEAIKDGVLLAKLINSVIPNTIDFKKIHKGKTLTRFNIVENQNHVLAGAKKIGVNLINIGVVDLEEGKIRLVNDMAAKISAKDSDTLRNLKNNPTEVLINWVNECLQKAGSNKQIKNLSSDISDSEAYTILLNYLAPKTCTKAPLAEKDLTKRAELLLQEADKLKLRKFVGPSDIVEGQAKLNFAFVANIFGSLKEISDADKAVPAPVIETKSESDHLQITIARLKKENEELKQKLAQNEAKTAELTKLYNDQKIENEQLKAKLKQLEDAYNSKNKNDADLVNLKKQIDAFSQEKSDLLKRIKELEEQLAALQKKYDSVKKENDELAKALNTAEAEMKKQDATILRLDKELDEKDDNIRDLLRQLTELKDRYDHCEGRLKKYVYDEYTRNETVREKQGKTVHISLKDAKIGSLWSGWLTVQSHISKQWWKKRFFVLKDNHLIYYRTDKDSDNEGKSIHIIAGSSINEVGDYVVRSRKEIKKEQKKARKAKLAAEQGKTKKEKPKKEKKVDKNKLHHFVFSITSPKLGDLMPGRVFRFSAESDQDMKIWARKVSEAVKALPSMDQVFFFVVPEAKEAKEAFEKNRASIHVPGKREHATTSSLPVRSEGAKFEAGGSEGESSYDSSDESSSSSSS